MPSGPLLNDNLMLRRVWEFDWSATSLGAIETWSADLLCVCRTILLSSMPMSILIGEEGLVVYNDASASMYGATGDNLLGRPVEKAVPQAAAFYRQMLARTFEGRTATFRDLPLTLVRHGRSERAWFDLDFTPIIGLHGHIHGALLVGVETTERVKALFDLQASRDRLDFALEASGIVGTWEVDFETEIVRSDERYALLHGVDPLLAKVGTHKDAYIQGIHSDDRDRVMATFDRAKAGQVYRCLHRVAGSQGERWIVASGRIARIAEGPPRSFAGVVVDVTEQIESAQDTLRQSEERFAKAFRIAPVPTAVCTRNPLQFLTVNEAFATVLGFTEAEVVGRSGHELPLWATTPSRQLLERQIEGSSSFRNIEIQLRTKHEDTLDCLICGEAMTTRGQECLLITIQDITERKRTQLELLAAIEAVLKDTTGFSRSVIEKLANIRRPGYSDEATAELSDLTAREQEILALLSQGASDADMIERLKVTRNTLRNHIARIYNKIHVHSRADAIVWARERGFTSPMSKARTRSEK